MKNIFIYFLVFGCFFTGLSCDKKHAVREYTEIISVPPPPIMQPSSMSEMPAGHPPIPGMMDGTSSAMPQMMAIEASVDHTPLTWQTPVGWIEEKGNGMRVVSFKLAADPSFLCTITTLGGAAGGLRSNIVRWMGQIKLNLESDAKLDQFIQNLETVKTAGDLTATVIDLTQLQADAPAETISMISAIISMDNLTVFVKMTGPKKSLSEQKEQFRKLCQTLQIIP